MSETLGHFCQMNLLEHDGPRGQGHTDGPPGTPLVFTEVSDLVPCLCPPEQSARVLAIYLSGMGTDDAAWLA